MSSAKRFCVGEKPSRNGQAVLHLDLEVHDRPVIDYLEQFDKHERSGRAISALGLGVRALRLASPTLDAEAVGRQLQVLIGPGSEFARVLDPNNKRGVLALIEDRVRSLVDGGMQSLLREFSLDRRSSALARLQGTLSDLFQKLRQDLGVERGKSAQIERSPAKGLDFQNAVHLRLAEWARQLGDEAQFVGDSPGLGGRKTGDSLISLEDCTTASGLRIVAEAKNQRYTLARARDELRGAKKVRKAVSGIFAFAKDCAPPEVGDFHRIGSDIYCTVDRSRLDAGEDLVYLEAAYKIARVLAVVGARKEAVGKLDRQRIHDQVEHLSDSVKILGSLAVKAGKVRRYGEDIESSLNEARESLEKHLRCLIELVDLKPTP